MNRIFFIRKDLDPISKQSPGIKKWFYPMLILIVWIISAFIVNPAGEFPINDDWAYAKNVFELGEKNNFYLDDWPAMTLISQTLYGVILVKLFGFSFTLLRFSILLLAVMANIVLYLLLEKRSRSSFLACMLSLGFCFTPLFFSLSFTFLTDIFFLSFVIFAIYSLILYAGNRKKIWYLLYIVFCVTAVMNRQHGFLLPLLIFFPFFREGKFTLKALFISSVPVAVCLAAHFGYILVLKSHHMTLNTWGWEKFIEGLKSADIETKRWLAGDMLLVCGMLLVPCHFTLLWAPKKLIFLKHAIFLAGCVFILFFFWPGIISFPHGPVALSNGIGPRLLKDHCENIDNRFMIPEFFQWALRILALVSTFALFFPSGRKNEIQQEEKNFKTGFLFLIVAYSLFSLMNEVHFDRYVLPLALLVLILKIPKAEQLHKSFRIPLILMVSLIAIVSVLQTRDYMNWQRTRWKAIELLNRSGIGDHSIDGGFEYNGWHKPGPGYTSDTRSWWWVDKDDYLIANGSYPGYWKKYFFSYQRTIPFEPDTLFILERIVKRNVEASHPWVKKELMKNDSLIRNNAGLMKDIASKAAGLKISADSMILLDAIWMTNTLPNPYQSKR